MKNQNREKYAYLEQLTTRQLEELLLADLDDDSGRDTSEVVFHILEVLREREKDPAQEPDVDQAWERFQTYYNTPEGEGQSLYPCVQDRLETHQEKDTPTMKKSGSRFAFPRRGLTTAAAVVALLFALMLGVQASGHDIFGALAQWSDEIFRFGASNQSKYYDMFLEELGKNDIPKNYVPTQFPDGFEASEPEVWSDNLGTSVQIEFHNSKGASFLISIGRYHSPDAAKEISYEKDFIPVKTCTTNSMDFFILSNMNKVIATWKNGTFMEVIQGDLSVEDVENILNSIGR